MMKPTAAPVIRLRGVRQNNLKNFDLDLPLNRLVVITGLSGSGKSSLAFDTLFAEGQRRYIETFSPYARQFFDRMDKPQVDRIEGIPPAIAIEQRNAVRTTRSTVGTMTEICDYMKVLWVNLAELHCRQCGELVRPDSPQQIWEVLRKSETRTPKAEVLVTFDLPLSEKLSLEESLGLISKQGYQRLLLGHRIARLDDTMLRTSRSALRASHLTVIQDRLTLVPAGRARFIEACEQAYHFGKGKLSVHRLAAGSTAPRSNDPIIQRFNDSTKFSNRLHCARCDIEYREPSPALFSFNHPVGACPTCKGFGRVISIDYDLAVPDRSRTLAEGAVKPWQTGHGVECQRDLLRMCRELEIPTNVPFGRLPRKWQALVIDGDPDYGKDEEHEWPRAWYGVKGYFRWLESKAYKMHIRVLLSRYRAYTPCPACHGARLRPEALLYRCPGFGFQRGAFDRNASMSLADFYRLPVRDSLAFIERVAAKRQFKSSEPLGLVLGEIRSRLAYLDTVGLEYLTLDRPTRSLSGGETERVNLTTCLGTRLVNTLFVLDEPSVGLHPRDTERLVRILQQLRNAGNSVVVVEHEAAVMRAADQIVDLGPGHGATGGQIVFQGTCRKLLKSSQSLTGRYLSGRKQIEIPRRRTVRLGESSHRTDTGAGARANSGNALHEAPAPSPRREPAAPSLKVLHASRHNLQDVTVDIPLGRFVCVTGVSGSGKTTLVREVFLPLLEAELNSQAGNGGSSGTKASARIDDEAEGGAEDPESRSPKDGTRLLGHEQVSRVVLVDQAVLGKTPRSNPAVYIGAFDAIRELFAESEPARQRGLNASAFSFNSAQGQCERCRGAGFEKIEMQFLSDVFIRCPDCAGRRYRAHILEVKCEVRSAKDEPAPDTSHFAHRTSHFSWSIADLLDATVDEVVEFLGAFPDSRPARRAEQGLQLLQEVGLGYLRLGQPINTLSGGESQRLKLVRHLVEAETGSPKAEGRNPKSETAASGGKLRASGFGLPSDFGLRPSGFRGTLFLFDEPTTGLHFEDVRVLIKVFQRLVDAGHSVWVIEHNLDVIKSADWVVDLGPEAGDQGGRVVAHGTPEHIAACAASHTGRALAPLLKINEPKPVTRRGLRKAGPTPETTCVHRN